MINSLRNSSEPRVKERHAEYLVRERERRALLETTIASVAQSMASIVLEIGCGHGHFLTAYAQTHPERLCVGVDIASDRIARADRKRVRAALTNLHFIRADANHVLDALPLALSLSAVFILFPDPWPKSRHHKHRVAQAEFFSRVGARLGEKGRVYFRTDYSPYFESVRAALDVHPRLMLAEEPWPFEFPTVFQNRAAFYYSLVAKARPSDA